MKLFLGGGGGGLDSIELDKRFVDSLEPSKPLLYIPIAIDTKEYPYSECSAWLSSVLGPLGVKDVIMWVEEDLKTKSKDDFAQFSGVYIGGGNTYKLLKELKEFGTLNILSSLVAQGLPIYGGSAGAIIFAKTIIPAGFQDENIVCISDFSALNLLGGYDLWCHYTGNEDDSIREYMERFNIEKIIACPENGGIIASDEGLITVGPGDIAVFNSEKRIVSPGELFV